MLVMLESASRAHQEIMQGAIVTAFLLVVRVTLQVGMLCSRLLNDTKEGLIDSSYDIVFLDCLALLYWATRNPTSLSLRLQVVLEALFAYCVTTLRQYKRLPCSGVVLEPAGWALE